MLVEHEVPLPEALRLAAASSGDFRMDRAGCRAADAVERGQDVAEAVAAAPELPPFLGLSSFAVGKKDALVRAARQAAETYRRRAEALADWLRLLLPVVFTPGIGASVTVGYALLLFWPWTRMLNELALP